MFTFKFTASLVFVQVTNLIFFYIPTARYKVQKCISLYNIKRTKRLFWWGMQKNRLTVCVVTLSSQLRGQTKKDFLCFVIKNVNTITLKSVWTFIYIKYVTRRGSKTKMHKSIFSHFPVFSNCQNNFVK